MRYCLIAAAALAVFFIQGTCGAETVYLKSGAAVSGSIAGGSDGSVELVTASGTFVIPRSGIDRIEKDVFRVTMNDGTVYEGAIEDLSADSMVLATTGGRRMVIARQDIAKAEPVTAVPGVPAELAAVSTYAAAAFEPPAAAAQPSSAPVTGPAVQQAGQAEPLPQPPPYAEITADGRVKRGFFGRGISGVLELSLGPWLNDISLDLGPYGGSVVSPGKTGFALGAEYLFRFRSGLCLGLHAELLSLGTKTHAFPASAIKTSGGITVVEVTGGYEFNPAGRFRPYARAGIGAAFTDISYNVSNDSVLGEGHKAGSEGLMFSGGAGVKAKVGEAVLAAELRYLNIRQKDGVFAGSSAGSFVPAVKICWVFN
ncbi:MAG: outer membrane beta-barrel protein [Elusimicrobiaceae bacterium]|nr:outer membrane beta-barrel protein [Elusimicrobiaceae bacterium]